MQRKEIGGTNGILRQPIVFESKQFKRAFYNDKLCSASEAILTVHSVTGLLRVHLPSLKFHRVRSRTNGSITGSVQLVLSFKRWSKNVSVPHGQKVVGSKPHFCVELASRVSTVSGFDFSGVLEGYLGGQVSWIGNKNSDRCERECECVCAALRQ